MIWQGCESFVSPLITGTLAVAREFDEVVDAKGCGS